MKINGEFIVHPAPDEWLGLPEAELPRALREAWERGARADVPDFDRLVGAGQLARIREVPRVEEELERWLLRHADSKAFDVAGCFLTGYWPGRRPPHTPLVRRLLDALDGDALEPAARNTVACAVAKAHPATTDADLAARAAATFRRILQEEPLDAYSAGTLAWMRHAADAPPDAGLVQSPRPLTRKEQTMPQVSRLVAALSALTLATLSAGTHDEPKDVLATPTDFKWIDAPPSLPKGAKVAVLEGDPSKKGPFVMRAKMPDGYRIPPHTHPKDERVTVLAGTLYLGMGGKFDEKVAKAMPAGSYARTGAGMKHFGWAKGETVIQVHGEGPWEMEYVDPEDDPRKKR